MTPNREQCLRCQCGNPAAYRATDNDQRFCRQCAARAGHPGVPYPWASLQMLVRIKDRLMDACKSIEEELLRGK